MGNPDRAFPQSIVDHLVALGIGLGALYWVVESALDAFRFHMGNFYERLLTPDANEIWMRSLVIGILLLLSYCAQCLIERKRAEKALRKYAGRLRALSHRLVEVQEAERRRLAYELHDELGELLTGLKLSLEKSTHLSVEVARTSLCEAQALVNDLMVRVRELSLDLRPAMLDDLGLLPALLWHFKRYTHQTQVQVIFKHAGLEGRRFAPEVETTTYRLVQEALTNVARHAGVGGAMVRLWADPEILSVQVEDQGIGFDPQTTLALSTSSGLAGMRERARLLGGQLAVKSAPGAGTCVTVELPLGNPAERRKEEGGA